MSGFQNAGVTKGVMILLGLTSLAVSLTDMKPYMHLQLVPHMTKYRQFWRLGVSPFAFTNSSELLLTELLLYNVGVGIERSFGSRKFASFAVISTFFSTALCMAAIILFHRFGLNSIPAGPYGLVFSLLWQYHRIVPSLYAFKVFGFTFTNKAFHYILALMLVSTWPPGSVLASISGLVVGYLYRTDTPFFLPQLTRPRRLWRPLKTFRIPLSVYRLLERLFSPFVGTSMPPRRGNRVLPGQVRDTPPSGLAGLAALDSTGGLRNLLSARAGLTVPTPRRAPTMPGDVTPETPTTTATAAGGARAAVGTVGEWVTGRGSGARAPTEQEISALSSMFPNLSRETVVRALQRSEYNTAEAVEALLEQGS